MSKTKNKILISEKIIAIFSLFTVGIFGIIWIIISTFMKKNFSKFLNYNIIQSITIGIFLYLINISNKFLISFCTKNNAFNFISEFINSVFVIKKIRFYEFNLSFSYFELILFIIFGTIIPAVKAVIISSGSIYEPL